MKNQLSLLEEYKAYDEMWEWLDAKGNKISTTRSQTSTQAAPLPGTASFGSFEPQYKRLLDYFKNNLPTRVLHCSEQALTVRFPNTGNQLKLRIIQHPTNNCLLCTLWDGQGYVLVNSPLFKTWDQVLDWLIGRGLIRAADRKLCEWLDDNGKRITPTDGPLPLFELADDLCDGCACVVEPVYCLFYEPYHLINKHKLCDSCLAEWIKLPKGFVDKFILVSNYNNIDGQIDDFIENLKLEQQDIDNMINEWNKRKKAGTLGLNNRTISTTESDFCNSATLLHLTANKTDFI